MAEETRSGSPSKATTPEPGKAPPPSRRPFRLGMVVGSLITVAVVLLIIQNSETVEVQWLAFDFRARLWTVLLVTLAAGGVVWETVKLGLRRGRRRARARKEALRQAPQPERTGPDGEGLSSPAEP